VGEDFVECVGHGAVSVDALALHMQRHVSTQMQRYKAKKTARRRAASKSMVQPS
jgi:hypothetical protein